MTAIRSSLEHSGPAPIAEPAGAFGATASWRRLASLGLLLLVWQAGAVLAADRLLPGPGPVLATFLDEVASGRLPDSLAVTLARVAVCFMLSMVIGGLVGYAMGRHRRLDQWLDGWLVVLLNVPALVIVVLCYVWLGLSETALIVAVALNKIPNAAVMVREGARALDPEFAELAAVYRLGRWTRLTRIVLPQLAPYLLAAARNGLALIWKIVLVVELLGRSSGIGFQLQIFFQNFDVKRLLAYSLAFVACVLAVELAVLRPLERRLAVGRP